MSRRFVSGVSGVCIYINVSSESQPHLTCGVIDKLLIRDNRIVQQQVHIQPDTLLSEGLADPASGKLSAVQQGVIDEQGFQCAFCMPGFVMAATGYLKTNPNPTRQELAHGISGNLCRCQDYDKILTALMRGAEHMRNA